MKINSRNQFALFCTLVLLLGTSFFAYVKYQQSQTLIIDIGSQKSQQAEERAAVQRLSVELTKHPGVRSVRILAGPARWRQGVLGFVRINQYKQKNVLWMDNRFSSAGYDVKSGTGIRAEVLASEEPIHEAAHHLSTFNNVNYYNEQLRLYPAPNVSQISIEHVKTLPGLR